MLTLLLVVTWHGRRSPAAGPFALMVVALLIWTFGYIFEIAAVERNAKLFWANIQFLGIAPLPVLWLDLVLAHLDRHRPRWSTPLLYLIPAATIALSWSGLSIFRRAPRVLVEGNGLRVLHADYGPWEAFVYMPYAYALSLIAIVLLIIAVRRSRGVRRWQSSLLLVGAALPLVTNVLYYFGATPIPDYNPSVAAFTVSGVLGAVALFRFRLFEVAPLAREAVVEHMSDAVMVLDRRERLADFNAAAVRLLPPLRPQMVGSPIADVLGDDLELLGCVLERGGEKAEVSLPLDGEKRHYSVEISPVRDERGRLAGHTVVLHDVTERVVLFERVKELASIDGLTGILNRRHFFELSEVELDRARRHDSPVTLVLFDLDHFKQINDTYGHQRGDDVLRAVAQACKDTLRSFDLFGRYGGEEFAALLPEVDPEAALDVAERLRQCIASVEGDLEDIDITASFGVASMLSSGNLSFDDLLRLADQALYRAKLRGRDRVELATCMPAPADGHRLTAYGV